MKWQKVSCIQTVWQKVSCIQKGRFRIQLTFCHLSLDTTDFFSNSISSFSLQKQSSYAGQSLTCSVRKTRRIIKTSLRKAKRNTPTQFNNLLSPLEKRLSTKTKVIKQKPETLNKTGKKSSVSKKKGKQLINPRAQRKTNLLLHVKVGNQSPRSHNMSFLYMHVIYENELSHSHLTSQNVNVL